MTLLIAALAAVPAEFGQLASLKTLNLFNNRITKLPDALGELLSDTTMGFSQELQIQLFGVIAISLWSHGHGPSPHD